MVYKSINKKFLSVLIAVIAAVFMAFGMTACGNNDEDVSVPAGAEKGTYYCEVDGDEYSIVLSDGLSVEFSVGDDKKEGKYSLSDTQLVFNFDSETVDCRYVNETIELTYNDKILIFIRKVNYTVKFVVNGGSNINDVSVLNGKTVAKPDDPERSGYEFVGWSTDENADVLFDFGNTVVTTDITLYARWKYIPKTNVITLPDGTDKTVTEGEGYSLGIPSDLSGMYDFIGWYSENDKQLTDAEGNSLEPWNPSLGNVTVKAVTEIALTYELTSDEEGYSVSGNARSTGATELTIPAYHEGKPVTEVYGFSDYASLTTVSIPDTVQLFATAAFSSCSKLASIEVYDAGTEVSVAYCSKDGVLFTADMHKLVRYPVAKADESYTIPAQVLEIESYAFSDIAPAQIYFNTSVGKLKTVVLPKNLMKVGDHAFYFRRALETVEFSSEAAMGWTVGDYAFYCTGLTAFPFNEKLTSIGSYSFAGNILGSPKFTSVEFPENTALSSVGDYAFAYGTKLQSFTFPASLKTMGEYVLSESKVKTINFADGFSLEQIPAHAFASCNGLASITIPDTVTQIGAQAFYNCQNLKSAEFSSKLTVIGSNAFESTRGLTQVVFPKTLKRIENNAFASSGLNSVTFNDGLEYIGAKAFFSTKIESVSIPSSVTEIAEGAFMKCSKLSEVTLCEGLQTIGKNAFYASKPATAQPDNVTLISINIPSTVTKFGENIFSVYQQINAIIVDNAAFLEYLPQCEGFSMIASLRVKEGIPVGETIEESFTKGETSEGYVLYTKKSDKTEEV